jgi:hypothetical protein
VITFAERVRIENEMLALLTPAERQANEASHSIGVVDDCYRCINCEIGSWNAWKENCNA